MRVARIASPFLAAAIGVAPSAAAFGQAAPPDLSGDWTLTLSSTLPDELIPCVHEGVVMLTMLKDFSVSAPVELSLLAGPAACPAEMLGTLNGLVFIDDLGQTAIAGTISGNDPGGQASFNGTFTPGAPPPVAVAMMLAVALPMQLPSSGIGDMSVSSGAFAGAAGTWIATPAPAVPALGPIVLTILVALLLAAGAYALRGRPPLDAFQR